MKFGPTFTIMTLAVFLLVVAAATSSAQVRVAGVGANSGNQAASQIFSSGDLAGSFTPVDAATFNSLSVTDLRASYDVLLFTWISTSAINADWNTRLLPYLALGGGVIFEDPGNRSDLSPGVQAFSFERSSLGMAISATVPGLTDGITNSFANNHIGFASWDARLAPFITRGTVVVGLFGEFPGCGRIVLTGPDQHFHGFRGLPGYEGNQYNLLLNEVRWVTSCRLEVEIDIKPGSDPNSVNPRSKGLLPVAILTTSQADGDTLDFDAGEVDPLSLTFGPTAAPIAHSMGHVEDVDGDGDLDLVVHFAVSDTGIPCGDTEATLEGSTLDGQQIFATGPIRTAGCK